MVKTRTKIQVLLSTYNGEKYLKELMDSVLNQEIKQLTLIIRDDGSNDNTLKILNTYLNERNIKIFAEKNIGAIQSFFKLLKLSCPNSDYFAFCDQDDIWERDKLSKAISKFNEFPEEIPLMYCSRIRLVNDKLDIIKYSKIPRKPPSFNNALVENIATGCTIVINNSARKLLLKKTPLSALMHDWWIYLTVSAFGKVIYDIEPKILYRLHSSNAVGIDTNFIRRWNKRIRRFAKRKNKFPVTQQIKEFQKIYGNYLPKDKEKILKKLIDSQKTLKSRVFYAFSGEIYRQSLMDEFILRILIIFNRI